MYIPLHCLAELTVIRYRVEISTDDSLPSLTSGSCDECMVVPKSRRQVVTDSSSTRVEVGRGNAPASSTVADTETPVQNTIESE